MRWSDTILDHMQILVVQIPEEPKADLCKYYKVGSFGLSSKRLSLTFNFHRFFFAEAEFTHSLDHTKG